MAPKKRPAAAPAAGGASKRPASAAAAAASPGRDPRFRSWPITEAKALEPRLKGMGLRVPASQIDGTSGSSGKCLSDALVSVGPAGHGGTGSFISKDGLIVTNHHVALDAVRQASSVEHDYLKDGFVARSRTEELAGPDYEVWITRACEDVSEQMLEVVRSEEDPLLRANKVRNKKHEIATAREGALAGGGIRCEVKEMFADKTYVLFTFERLLDVRIVYVPPMCLGNFGGDTDNFEWPRHSADFTLLRAYVGPDGKAATPGPENVPYKPTKYLRACPKGVGEGDFVFLLGFPGHTMRYAPTSRLAFADEVAVPNLIADFGRKLELIRKHTGADRAVALKTMSTRKSLANNWKRSRGKRVMYQKLGLLAERAAEEAALRAASAQAGPLLDRLADVYDELRALEPRSAALELMRGAFGGSALLYAGHVLHEASREAARPDSQREEEHRERNRPFLSKQLQKRLASAHPPLESDLVADACRAAREAGLPLPSAMSSGVAEAEIALSRLLSLSPADIQELLAGNDSGNVADEIFVRAAASVYADYAAARDKQKALLSERDQLLAKLLEQQRAHSEEEFYPDANGTLRLSAGHIEGYVAADAVHHAPITTLAGLLDKHVEAQISGNPELEAEFACPQRLAELLRKDSKAAATPVNCLYSTDTVGGNSGSPVMNAKGEFVAINFDRQRLGLMNEFKWSSKFSRSMGADVRYILWLVGEYDGAVHLVKEMTE